MKYIFLILILIISAPSQLIAKDNTVVKKWQYEKIPDLINDTVRHVFFTTSTNNMTLLLTCENDFSAWMVILGSRPLRRPKSYIMRIDGGVPKSDGISSQEGRNIVLTTHPKKVDEILDSLTNGSSVVIRIIKEDGRKEDSVFDTSGLSLLTPNIKKACNQ